MHSCSTSGKIEGRGGGIREEGGEGGYDDFLQRSLFRGRSPLMNGHIKGMDVMRYTSALLFFFLLLSAKWIDFRLHLVASHLHTAIAIATRSKNHLVV